MNEALLHFVWKFKSFQTKSLESANGSTIQLIQVGQHNLNSGPDFFNAQIRISDTLWAGNVEIHVKSSDWYDHKHHQDEAYQSVILHVVWEDDINFELKTGIPTLELRGRVSKHVIEKYRDFQNLSAVPCSKALHQVKPIVAKQWVERMGIARLEERCSEIELLSNELKGDLEGTFYHWLMRYWGGPLNKVPFTILARVVPFSWIKKRLKNKEEFEAILFGQAGLLADTARDTYEKFLKQTYSYWKLNLPSSPLAPHFWKYSKMRPSSFPDFRMAQVASLLFKYDRWLSRLMERDLSWLGDLFETYEPGAYWSRHVRLGTSSKRMNSQWGKGFRDYLHRNVFCPFIYFVGNKYDDYTLKELALAQLEAIRPEDNRVTRIYKEHGLTVANSLHTQGLLHMYEEFCNQKKCLFCGIGNQLLRNHD